MVVFCGILSETLSLAQAREWPPLRGSTRTVATHEDARCAGWKTDSSAFFMTPLNERNSPEMPSLAGSLEYLTPNVTREIAMDLVAFRVSMYKGIVDSGWVEVTPLTVLVGKNESGKTSLLKALHKLNPYNPEPYEMAKEWPRGRRRERDEEHIVCQAKFHLSAQEKAALAQIAASENVPDTVEVSRNYAGQLEVNFGADIFPDKLPPNDVNTACEALPKVQEAFGDVFKQRAAACVAEAKRLAHEGRFRELSELVQQHEPLLQEAVTPSEPQQHLEFSFIDQYLAGLQELVAALEQ